MSLLLYTVVLFALITMLWKVSSTGRCYLRYVFFGVMSGITASAPIPLMFLRPRDSRNGLIPAAALLWSCQLIGVTTSVEGHENIVQNSGTVVLINHQSSLDLLVVAKLWHAMDNCTVVVKKKILLWQPFAFGAWLWGTIYIDRVKKGSAQATLNKATEKIKASKARVLMFPEGTRSLKNKLLPFKKGAFHLAIASQCPIQPVVVNRYEFLGKNKFDNGHIRIKILPPISTENYSTENIDELMEKAYKVMSENFDSLTKNQNNKIKEH